MRSLLPFGVLACGVAAMAACGPSYQVLYEGDAHFERCYAIDERADVPLETKSQCWNAYIEYHSYGQTRDRIRYAGIRAKALARLPALPTDEAMMAAAPGESLATVNAPAPTNAFAPPPKMLASAGVAAEPRRDVANAATPSAAPVNVPPQADCAETCNRNWNECRGKCSSDRNERASTTGSALAAPRSAAPSSEKCGACERSHRACMRACYK